MERQKSVEDYCIYCNLVSCEKESEECTMVSETNAINCLRIGILVKIPHQ
ncbi:unnamed protein product [Natator depressus]